MTIFILITIIALFHSLNLPSTGWVAEVIDGDTIMLKDGRLLRYLGVNTPEIREKDGEVWVPKMSPWGEKAYLYNKKMTEGKKIRIEYDKKKRDRYGRLLGYVFVKDGLLNSILLRKGLAVIDLRAPNFKYLDLLAKSFQEGIKKRKGIWGNIAPISPQIASKFQGKIVILQGKVLDVYQGKELTFLLLPTGFKLIIFKDNLPLFDLSTLLKLKDKNVRAYGIVKKYRGNFEMILHHPYQLEVME